MHLGKVFIYHVRHHVFNAATNPVKQVGPVSPILEVRGLRSTAGA